MPAQRKDIGPFPLDCGGKDIGPCPVYGTERRRGAQGSLSQWGDGRRTMRAGQSGATDHKGG